MVLKRWQNSIRTHIPQSPGAPETTFIPKSSYSSTMASPFFLKAVVALLSASTVTGFKIGSYTTETHPKMTWKRCTGKGGSSCSNVSGEVVIDSNWRWLHKVGDYKNCYDGNKWDSSVRGSKRTLFQTSRTRATHSHA